MESREKLFVIVGSTQQEKFLFNLRCYCRENVIMSSIITGILRSIKDGDLTEEKLRETILCLTDINSQLDCQSLKDLRASCSFLKEGVESLNLALNKSNEDQKASDSSVSTLSCRDILDPYCYTSVNVSVSRMVVIWSKWG